MMNDVASAKFCCSRKHISTVYTMPQFRSRRLAVRLILSVMNLFPSDGFLYVADSIANVASNNLAKACGFSVVGYNNEALIEKITD
jgi:Acetyltransferases